VNVYKNGGSDEAGFVQVIMERVIDPNRFREEARGMVASRRDDVIGSVAAWGWQRFTEVVFFTSEEEARKGSAVPSSTSRSKKCGP
jgi:hypothetical protein